MTLAGFTTIRPFRAPWHVRLGWLALFVYLAYATSHLELTWLRFLQGIGNGATFIGRMLPPNFERWELLLTGMAGYAFAKLRFRGRQPLFRALLYGMVVPGQVAMLPMFLLLRELGLINTLLGAMIPVLAPIYGIFLVRQYALSIPDDLLDAARLDGAGEWRLFRSVVLPAIAPVLATLGVFTFLAAWNDFMWPLIVLSDDRRYTLPVALANLAGEHVQDVELIMGGAVVTVLPVFVAFLFLQRYYIQGIMAGSVKG